MEDTPGSFRPMAGEKARAGRRASAKALAVQDIPTPELAIRVAGKVRTASELLGAYKRSRGGPPDEPRPVPGHLEGTARKGHS